MKTKIILFFIALLPAIVIAQWQLVNPLSSLTITSVSFISPDIGWATTNSEKILNTTNGGLTWTLQKCNEKIIPSSLQFINETIGYTVSYGTILKTTNSGKNWNMLLNDQSLYFNKISFADENHGWVIGRNADNYKGGFVFYTSDGGSSWDRQLDQQSYIHSFSFYKGKFGLAIGDDYANKQTPIYMTSNSGKNWSLTNLTDILAYSSCMLDSLTALIGTNSQTIYKTTNGGQKWEKCFDFNTYIGGTVSNFSFTSPYNVWATAYPNDILAHSTDSGRTWTTKKMGTVGSVCFYDSLNGWYFSQSSSYKTTDGGVTWSAISENFNIEELSCVQFINEKKGFVGGVNTNGEGILIKTNDSGKSWEKSSGINKSRIDKILFYNDMVGYLIGQATSYYNGINFYSTSIQKTVDSGNTWNNIYYKGGHGSYDIAFVTPDIGWYSEFENALIRKTTDGGLTWTNQEAKFSSTDTKKKIFFLDENFGWVYSPQGLFQTSNGGISWNYISKESFLSAYFGDKNNGIAITDGTMPGLPTTHSLKKTIDGGKTWMEILINHKSLLLKVLFKNKNEGILVGCTETGLIDYPFIQEFFCTTDGGTNWINKSEMLINNQKIIDVTFAGNADCWLITQSGAIMNYANIFDNTTDVKKANIIPFAYSLSQNYPNPFNPSTTIDYQLSASGFVTLKVYDLLGRVVATLVDEYKTAGSYNSQFSIRNYQLASGVYFYRLQCGSYSQTKKLILEK